MENKNKNSRINVNKKSIWLTIFVCLTVVLYINKNDLNSNKSCYLLDLDLDSDVSEFSHYYDINLKEIENKLKYKKIKLGKKIKLKEIGLKVSLGDWEKDIINFKYPWVLEKKLGEELILRSLLKPEFMVSVSNNVGRNEVSCFIPENKKFVVDQCVKVKEPMKKNYSYYRIVKEEGSFYDVKGIYNSYYNDRLMKNLTSSPIFDVYYPNNFYPQKKSIKFIEEYAQTVSCPENIVVKFSKGQCIKDFGKILNINRTSGIIEVALNLNKKRELQRQPASDEMEDFLKSRLDNGLKDFFLYEQDQISKDPICNE